MAHDWHLIRFGGRMYYKPNSAKERLFDELVETFLEESENLIDPQSCIKLWEAYLKRALDITEERLAEGNQRAQACTLLLRVCLIKEVLKNLRTPFRHTGTDC